MGNGCVMCIHHVNDLYHVDSAQEWTNRTLISHERTSVHFLVLPGSQLSFAEITEYTYISVQQTLAEFKYKID